MDTVAAPPTETFANLSSIGSIQELPAEFYESLIRIRRHLHQHPELGFEETATSRFIRETLERHGLKVHGPIAETGLFVDIHGEQPGGCVGYRADIDALPIRDAKQVPYASRTPGVAHLCGHDAHTTIAIGVALLLHRFRADLHGTVRVFFQPNEEGAPSGSVAMIRNGVLQGLEAAYAIHVDPTLEVGRFGLIKGPITAAADRFRVTVKGERTGHSARPHHVHDTVWIATQIMNTLYQLSGRVTDTRNASVITITRLQAGEAYNVVPDRASFGGTIRCTQAEDRDFLKHYIRHSAEHIAALHQATVDVVLDQGVPPVSNDGALIDNVTDTIIDLFGEDAIFQVPLPSMGSEDFAHYLEHIPGALIRLGTSSGPRTSHALHDSMFDIDEDSLAPAVQLITQTLVNHLRQGVLHE